MSHRDALRVIAEAALGQVYCDRDGRVRVTVGQTYQPTTQRLFLEGAPFPAEVPAVYEAYGISPDDYFSLSTPSRQGQLANEIIVDTQPLRPSATTEVYRSNELITVSAGKTVNIVVHYNQPPVIGAMARLEGATDTDILTADFYGWGAEIVLYNAGMADEQVTLIIEGQPLQVQNKERAMTRDEASIRDNGRLRYEFPANHLVQSLPVAQQIADSLLASYKDPRRDVRLEWRGNPALELGDLITVPESPDKTRRGYFVVVRQELTWAGALVEGLRAYEQSEVKTMPGNTKAIVRDVNAQPAPQLFDPSKDAYDYLLGDKGAMRAVLYDANGNPLLTATHPGYVRDEYVLAKLADLESKLDAIMSGTTPATVKLTGSNVEQTLLFDGTIAAGGTAFLPSNWTTVCISKNRPFAIVANTYGLFKKWKITVIFRAGTNGNQEYITDNSSFVIDKSTTASRSGSVVIDVPRGSHFNLQVENLETTDINIRIWLVQL
jgi:hypothetical protein